jgi:hypothetical protein
MRKFKFEEKFMMNLKLLNEKGVLIMKKKRVENISHISSSKAYCHFCGATVGQISDRTEEKVSAIYDCPKCKVNYCDQCSYGKNVNGKLVQFCLRCESKIEKVM